MYLLPTSLPPARYPTRPSPVTSGAPHCSYSSRERTPCRCVSLENVERSLGKSKEVLLTRRTFSNTILQHHELQEEGVGRRPGASQASRWRHR